MTREELIQLSGNSFTDNDTGDITPAVHREFNEELIAAMGLDTDVKKCATKTDIANMVSVGEWEDLNITYHESLVTTITAAKIRDFGAFFILYYDLTLIDRQRWYFYIKASNLPFGNVGPALSVSPSEIQPGSYCSPVYGIALTNNDNVRFMLCETNYQSGGSFRTTRLAGMAIFPKLD